MERFTAVEDYLHELRELPAPTTRRAGGPRLHVVDLAADGPAPLGRRVARFAMTAAVTFTLLVACSCCFAAADAVAPRQAAAALVSVAFWLNIPTLGIGERCVTDARGAGAGWEVLGHGAWDVDIIDPTLRSATH